jgi:ssDNA-binding Zn-finger/Zn-ribbon topoisomerase 1
MKGWENAFTGESEDGETELDCPECGGKMRLVETKKGRFYGCENFPDCQCTHGCHPDGSPLGVPADRSTRDARIETHRWFDALWKQGKMSRHVAYKKLQAYMRMGTAKCHIGRFTKEQCERATAFAKTVCKLHGIQPEDVDKL